MGMFPTVCKDCNGGYFWHSHTPVTIARTSLRCEKCWDKREAQDPELKQQWEEAFLKEKEEMQNPPSTYTTTFSETKGYENYANFKNDNYQENYSRYNG